MSVPELGPQRYRPTKPIHAILFGLFSVIFGAVLTFAIVALAAISDLPQVSPQWPLALLASIGYVACGIGFLRGKSWAWVASILFYGGSLGGSVVQAFARVYVWGIFIEPVILVYLLVPRVRAYFFSTPNLPPTVEKVSDMPESSKPTTVPKRTRLQIIGRENKLLTAILMLAIVSVVPFVALSVHAISVTGVTLNIVYPGNPPFPWFGDSPQTVSGSMFTWGLGMMSFRFSLDNLGLFQSHSIDSISIKTPGFILYAPTTPISIPDLAQVTLSMRLQAPDSNYYGPVTIEIQTS